MSRKFKNKFLVTVKRFNREVDIYIESVKNRRTGKVTKRVVARIGKGFSKDDYKKRPKGSIITYTNLKRLSSDKQKVISNTIQAIEVKLKIVRKGLMQRIRNLPSIGKEFNLEKATVRRKIVEFRTTKKLNHAGRVLFNFEILYTDESGKTRTVEEWGTSFRTDKPINKLTETDLLKAQKQASKMAAAKVINNNNIMSSDIFLVNTISSPAYWYDIEKTKGSYRKKPNREAETELKSKRGFSIEEQQIIKRKFINKFINKELPKDPIKRRKILAARRFLATAKGSMEIDKRKKKRKKNVVISRKFLKTAKGSTQI